MSKYQVIYANQLLKSLQKLDKPTLLLLKKWIEKHLKDVEDPRALGKGLTGNRKGLWRYRVGSYRLICRIDDTKLTILALTFEQRRSVYD